MSNKKETAVKYLTKEFSEILGKVATTPMQDLLLVDAINIADQMQKDQLIGLLQWMNKVASETPMRLETDLDDIVEQYIDEKFKGE